MPCAYENTIDLLARRGTALLTVLVMVVLLGLAAGMAGQSLGALLQREREAELLWRGQQYRQAMASYYGVRQGAQKGMFPSKLEDLLRDPRSPAVIRHLRRLYNDPMTGKEWELIKDQGGRIIGVRSTSELAPFQQTGFPGRAGGIRRQKLLPRVGIRLRPAQKRPKPRRKAPVQRLRALPSPRSIHGLSSRTFFYLLPFTFSLYPEPMFFKTLTGRILILSLLLFTGGPRCRHPAAHPPRASALHQLQPGDRRVDPGGHRALDRQLDERRQHP